MTGVAESVGQFAMPGVDQVGVVVRNVDQSVELLTSAFGIKRWQVLDIEFSDGMVRGKAMSIKGRFAFAQVGPVQIELIQPLTGNTVYEEHLATRGEGLHHLGFLVPDLEERVAEMAKRGVGVLQSGRTGRDGAFAYLDTTKSAGVIFEYIRATPGMVKYFDSIKELGKSK